MGKLICLCNLVEEKEVRSLLKKGACSTNDIQRYSKAGTSCGRCLPEIDELVSAELKEKPKGPQKKLDFGF